MNSENNKSYQEQYEEAEKALAALEFVRKINGGLTKDEQAQVDELKKAAGGFKVLATLYDKSYVGQVTKVETPESTTPKMEIKKRRRGRKGAGDNFPVIYSASLTQKQKMYCLLNELGSATYADLRAKVEEYEPNKYNEHQLIKLVEIGMMQLNKLGKIEYTKEPKMPRVYKIKKATEEAA